MNNPEFSLLVADDNPALRAVIRLNLERAGYAVTVASDGCEALELAREGQFDLILLDHQMPEMDGPACCGELRRLARYAKTPVVVITAKCFEPEELRHWNQLSVARVLAKPFNVAELIELVAQLLDSPAPPRTRTTVNC